MSEAHGLSSTDSFEPGTDSHLADYTGSPSHDYVHVTFPHRSTSVMPLVFLGASQRDLRPTKQRSSLLPRLLQGSTELHLLLEQSMLNLQVSDHLAHAFLVCPQAFRACLRRNSSWSLNRRQRRCRRLLPRDRPAGRLFQSQRLPLSV